ncbi:Crp/Fnr family transcriptional regulator [Brevundimonas lutea]|uniref:Crp/Fnr family transcriptional regulator n=1 Tax=Brevundimonas lutea TaxID=2293980 RepID=UPI0013CE52CD|nr:Crp/Fnr family transcriptional regulator [Brevundimonas lutea]
MLDSFPADDLARLRPHLVESEVEAGEVLYEPGSEIDNVYFPRRGLVSIVSVLFSGQHVVSSILGRESGAGFVEACGGGLMHSRVIVQTPGTFWRVPTQPYRKAFNTSLTFRRAIGRHIEFLLTEARQEIACHAVHRAEHRLARVLLVCQDKSGLNELEMTQEMLATMVATQRTTISGVAISMKRRGMLDYARGRIRIRDVPALERQACECYATMKNLRDAMGQPADRPARA